MPTLTFTSKANNVQAQPAQVPSTNRSCNIYRLLPGTSIEAMPFSQTLCGAFLCMASPNCVYMRPCAQVIDWVPTYDDGKSASVTATLQALNVPANLSVTLVFDSAVTVGNGACCFAPPPPPLAINIGVRVRVIADCGCHCVTVDASCLKAPSRSWRRAGTAVRRVRASPETIGATSP